MDILGFKAPTKTQSESVVYHGRIESELDKLSGTELRAFQSEFESMLRKYFPEDYGELDGIGENGIDMRQIGPFRNHGEIG